MTPELIVLCIMVTALCLYAVLGGADFGAGVWEFTTMLQSDRKQRQLIQEAIGPVWEANHVWLVFVVIILLNGFPLAFAALSRSLLVPLFLALLGIVFRGAGFVFRAYGVGSEILQRYSGAVFALASTATPFFLGASVGAISTGHLQIDESGDFHGDTMTDWLTPLSLYSGILAVGMCAYLASVYLTRDASTWDDESLLRIWRGRALATGIWIGILAWLGLVMAALEAPLLWSGLMARGWPLIAVSLAAGIGSLAALVHHNYRSANAMAATAVASVILGWALGQYPHLVPPHIAIENSKAPAAVLWAMAICILAGSLLLFPSLYWLLQIFKGERPTTGAVDSRTSGDAALSRTDRR